MISVLCLGCGLGLSIRRPLTATRISGIGALLCALAIIGTLMQLIHAIPFHQQPGQAGLLLTPGIFLVVMIFHMLAAAYKHKAEKNQTSRGH
jgi:hypothetical protein